MDQVLMVRHAVLAQKRSVRAVAREFKLSRNTVRRYVAGAEVGVRKPAARGRPVTAQATARIVAIVEASKAWTAGKQRLTAARVHALLREEGVVVGQTVVKAVMRELRRQRQEVFVPLQYRPGDLAEVDFFEVWVDVLGVRQKAHLFVMRLMASGRDFAWLYPRQDQACFLDGHVRAFAHFGAAPQRCAYDNLKAAVTKHLVGSERELAARFLALTTHYAVETSFCRPRTGHDKGGVEARGKGIRWQELVPIPDGPSLAAISAALLARLDARLAEVRRPDGRLLGEVFVDERAAMLALPDAPFRVAAAMPMSASRRGLVKVLGATYSVWSRWAGLDVVAYAGVDTVEIVGPDGASARVVHPRARFGAQVVDYRHYIPALAQKPQAVRQCADGLVRDLGEPYAGLWRLLVDQHGPKVAARIFAKVLGRIVVLGDEAVRASVAAALISGEPVLLALRDAAVETPTPMLPPGLAELAVDGPTLADFDHLLGGAA